MAAFIPLIIAIISAIPSLVQAAEALHDAKGGGPVKKGFVLDAIGKILDIAKTAEPKIAKVLTADVQKQITDVSGAAVDQAVAVMNATDKEVKP